jgi:hypothetical protein
MLSEAKHLCSSHMGRGTQKVTAEILREVYPEPTAEILRFAQNDRRRAEDGGERARGQLF